MTEDKLKQDEKNKKNSKFKVLKVFAIAAICIASATAMGVFDPLIGGTASGVPTFWIKDQPWEIPTDPQGKAQYDLAHNIKLPDSMPKPVPFHFWLARLRALIPGQPNVSEQYFRHLCETEAGEHIFQSIPAVEGLLQMRARNRSSDRDLWDRYRLEDPYGYELGEAYLVAFRYVQPNHYKFFEQITPGESFRSDQWSKKLFQPSMLSKPMQGDKYVHYSMLEGFDFHRGNYIQKEFLAGRKSRYGYIWRGITRNSDRQYLIAGGELIVMDLETQRILGVRRGFLKASTSNRYPLRWDIGRVCPNYFAAGGVKNYDFNIGFIEKVLNPKAH